MSHLKVNMFGEFRVRRGGDLVEGEEWDRQKTRSLLKLLLTRPGRAFSRDDILETLWPGMSPKAAERSLWVTVSLLRRVLEPDLERGSDSRYILQRRPGYAFDERADCRVDAWEFEEHRKKAEAARETGEPVKAINEYRSALDLVEGEFLGEDPYEDWAIEARQEWRERHLSVLAGLADCLAQKGRYTEAIGFCEKALALDRYREDLHRRLMLYHYCAGEQGLALQAYRNYAGVLEKELGTAPSPELARLEEQIQARDVPGVDEGRRRYPRPRRPLWFPYSLSRTHFVGRDREYALLAERLREAAGGRGGAVVVEGEAGVGKTRLVEEFLGYARSRGVCALSGRCYERDLAVPLEPILEAVSPLVNTDAMFAAGTKYTGITDHRPQATEYGRTQVYREIAGELIRISRDAGHEALVLFVDDMQWADPATLEFLSYAARRIVDEPILLLFAYRREDAPLLSRWIHRLAERRAVTATVNLERLSREDLSQVLARLSSRGFGELPRLAEFLHRESEGNPFYAVEYLRWLIEAGIVRIDARRHICALEGEGLAGGVLPSGIQALIEARLADLDEATSSLLEFAAVVGRTFDLGLLRTATSRREAEIFACLGPVMASGLVVETPQGEYYFSHDKLRQSVYEGMSGPRLRELHLQVAGALKDTGGEPAELAHHYLRAREWRPALENLVRAARRAEDGYAWETALETYARALEVAAKLPDSEEERFELLEARERLLEHVDRREERAQTVAEIFALASRLGDRVRLADVHLRRMGALAALGDPSGVAEAGRAALAIFRDLGDRPGEARVHRELGYVRWVSKDYAGALKANFEALRIHRELGDRPGEAGDAGNIAQVYRGMGDHEQALWWAGEATRLYHELGDKVGEGMRLTTMAAIHRERGDLKTALSLNLKTLRLNDEVGAKKLNVAQHSTCGTLHLSLGDSETALEHFRHAARLARKIGYVRDEGNALMSVGFALERLGDPSGAADAYRRAVELLKIACQESGSEEELSARAEAQGLLATVLHRSLDRPEEALISYKAATETCRELGDEGRLCGTLLSLAGLRWKVGRLEESARDYEEALEFSRQRGETAHEAAALASLSVVYRDLDRLRASLRCGRAALELLRDLDDLRAEAYVLGSLAESHRKLGHLPSAISCLKRSLRLRHEIGDAEGEVMVLRYLAEVYESQGNAARARDALEKMTRKEAALMPFPLERSS